MSGYSLLFIALSNYVLVHLISIIKLPAHTAQWFFPKKFRIILNYRYTLEVNNYDLDFSLTVPFHLTASTIGQIRPRRENVSQTTILHSWMKGLLDWLLWGISTAYTVQMKIACIILYIIYYYNKLTFIPLQKISVIALSSRILMPCASPKILRYFIFQII